jgi:hypothetical protein
MAQKDSISIVLCCEEARRGIQPDGLLIYGWGLGKI